jgi:carboxylesterase type B
MLLFLPSWHRHLGKAVSQNAHFHLSDQLTLAVVHASDIPYVFGSAITPFINQPVDLALSRTVQQAWISFASHLDPNALGKLSPGVSWPTYQHSSEQVLVFQTPDGAEGKVGQGVHTEKDMDDRPMCDFIISEDAQFIH